MKQYLQNLLPRLQEFSKSLDKKELFVDKPWVLIDEEGNYHKYIFERNGNLIMSFQGQVTQGSWRYIAASNALLVKRRVDEILLKNAFVDNGIMLLKMDDYSNSGPKIFANETVIPDLDIQKYLTNILIQKLHLKTFLYLNKPYYYSDPDGLGINTRTIFYDERFQKTNNSFNIPTGNGEYKVQNGVVAGFFYIKNMDTDKGKLRIASTYDIISKGDRVTNGNVAAQDGLYVVKNDSNYKSITIKDGSIYSLEKQKDYFFYIFFGLIALIIIGFFIMVKLSSKTSASNTTTDGSLTHIDSTITQNGAVDSIAQPTQDIYSDEDYKTRVQSFIYDINNRNFEALTNYFPPVVQKYYNAHNLSNSEVIQNIRNYLMETLIEGTTILDTSSILTNKMGSDYLVEAIQLVHSRSSIDKVPMFYYTKVKYIFDDKFKIKSISGTILDKGYDYKRLFNIPLEANFSVEDFMKFASLNDFNRMFNQLISSAETPEYKQALKTVMVENFGASLSIYINTSSEYTTLELFCDKLINNEINFSNTSNIYRSSTDIPTRIDVTYSAKSF